MIKTQASNMLAFVVAGHPTAQPRHRFNTNTHQAYLPKTAKIHTYKNSIAKSILECDDFRYWNRSSVGPYWLSVVFVMPVPSSLSKPEKSRLYGSQHDKKPDLDNLVKGLKDAMTEAGVWPDDSLVSVEMLSKRYCKQSENPFTSVRVINLEGRPIFNSAAWLCHGHVL